MVVNHDVIMTSSLKVDRGGTMCTSKKKLFELVIKITEYKFDRSPLVSTNYGRFSKFFGTEVVLDQNIK